MQPGVSGSAITMTRNMNVCLNFDLFMHVVFHTTKLGVTLGSAISNYLFSIMNIEFILSKYGDGKFCKKQFYDTFSLCIYMNDTDIIEEYWENMMESEREK